MMATLSPLRAMARPPVVRMPGARNRRSCILVATGWIPSEIATIAGQSLSAIEASLERAAADLEGDGDQDLVIKGDGEDGDIVLTRMPSSLRSQAGRKSVRLRLEIDGEAATAHGAACELSRIFGSWVVIDSVTMASGEEAFSHAAPVLSTIA
jgi:hypothetical protein